MQKKIFSVLIISAILSTNIHVHAEVNENFEGSSVRYKNDYSELLGEKVGFLVEGTDLNGKIKREASGYLIDDFLENDSVKNINSGFNGDYGNVRLETSSQNNIASYFPSVFNWNIPHKIYKLDGNGNRSSGEAIYNSEELNNLCTYGFTRSIGEDNDISTKVDIYGVSKDGRKLIGKDVYNTAILNKIEKRVEGENDVLENAIEAAKNNAIVIKSGRYHEIYNYSNYGGEIKKSIMGPSMTKYSLNAYLESVKGDMDIFDSAVRFSEIKGNDSKDIGNGKVSNYIEILGGGDSDDKHKFFIINNNKFRSGADEVELDTQKLFIEYDDIINSLSSVDTRLVENIKKNYLKNINSSIPSMMSSDENSLYEKGRLKNTLLLLTAYLEGRGINISADARNLLSSNSSYSEARNDVFYEVISELYNKFFASLELDFKVHYSKDEAHRLGDLTDNFNTHWPVSQLEEISTRLGFFLYDFQGDDEYSFNHTVSYGDMGSSFGNFPSVTLEDGTKLSFEIGFRPTGELSDTQKGIYNSIIGGSSQAVELIENEEFSYIYGVRDIMKESPSKHGLVNMKFLYNSPGILDFYFKYDIRDINVINNLTALVALGFNYFNNGEPYKLRDISKEKVTTKHPYVFPISQFIDKNQRDYAYYSSSLGKLKDGENSYFKNCLSEGTLRNLYTATPESDVYTKKITKEGEDYLVTYKVLEFQFKFAGELAMGTDFGFYGDMPPSESINLGNFMNNNPLKTKSFDGKTFKSENFLSGKNINIWSGFKNRTTDKYSYAFRVFQKAGDNLLSYKENGASNRFYDTNSGHSFQPIKNELKKINSESFLEEDSVLAIQTGKENSNIGSNSFTNEIYSTIACPEGYSLVDDYKAVYERIFNKTSHSSEGEDNLTRFQLLEKLNYRKVSTIEHQAITSYFNDAKPFCVHSSLPRDTDSIMRYLKKMFIIDDGTNEMGEEERYIYTLENNSNPFMYYNAEKEAFTFSTAYLNTLRSLFASEYQRFPSYNKISEGVGTLYGEEGSKNMLGYIDYTSDKEGLIDSLILHNAQKEDKNGIPFSQRYNTQKSQILSILNSISKVKFSGIYGMNLLANSEGNPTDFSNSINSEIFPIVGAVKLIKSSGSDFFCKDEFGVKKDSLILGGDCYNKETGNKANNEKVYINKGSTLAKSNGAFLNNTTLLPFFRPGVKIKDTSGTLFLNKSVSQQGALPFISNTTYEVESGDLPLKPRITALRGINSNELIEKQLNKGYGYRAAGFFFPYARYLEGTQKLNFNNILINSNLDTDIVKICSNILNPKETTDSSNGVCPNGFFPSYKNGTYYPYLIHNLDSNSIGVKGDDYDTLDVPLAFGDVSINKDMDYYTRSNILNKKAEMLAGKSSAIIYTGDYSIREPEINLLTGYVESEKDEKDTGDFYLLSMINNLGGMNNNSVYYEVQSNYIPEVCLFGNTNLNSCIEEYNTFDPSFINNGESSEIVDNEKVCLELDGTERVYLVGAEAENDIDQTGYCNLSCTTTSGEQQVFSSNNFFLFTENQGDLVCRESEPTKLKIFDGYSVDNSLKDSDKTRDLGRFYPDDEGDNGTGVPLNDDDGLCYYNNEEDGESVICTDGFLSRKNSQRKKDEIIDIQDNPGYRNGYHYVNDPELGKNVSSNFNGVYNNDLIILTSNTKKTGGGPLVLQGGYIGHNESIVDSSNGGIREPYIFSDNDNTIGEGEIRRNSSLSQTNTKSGRQSRRDRIKEQIRISAGSNNEINQNPNSGLNFLAYKIPKDDFYSLNGILRIAKDPRKYFTNLKIQNPTNESELLSDVNIFDTYFSYNNLTIKYGDRFYTWGNNDASCNGINPNEVYNKIDLIDGDKAVSREDTMTLCLHNNINLSEKHELSNDIYIILPIKPTKSYNSMNIGGTVERNIDMNTAIVVENGYIKGDRRRRDTTFNLETYFQGYFTNSSNSIDVSNGFLDIFDSGTSDRAMKGRYVHIHRESKRKRCKKKSDGRRYWYEGYTEYSANFNPNKILLEEAPKVFANGMITRHPNGEDKSIFVLPISISTTESSYSGSSGRKELRRGSRGSYGCGSDGEDKREARRDARENMTRNIEYFDQADIRYGSVNSSTTISEFNKGNIINSFYVPGYDINNYRNNLSLKSGIKDAYYKGGNLLNNLGTVKSNQNYVKASLSENEYKINIGDYLEFEHELSANGEFTPQLMYLKTQLDRGLELDISTLEITKNGLRQSPILTEDEETKEIIGDIYNTSYIISKINSASNSEKKVFESNNQNSYNESINLRKNEKITVTKGKLFLEVLSDNAKVYGSKGTKYWRGTDSDITLIFERNNGIIKKEDLSDIFTDIGTELQQGDILTIGAGEFIRFSDSSISVRVIPFHSLPEYLLNFSRDKVIKDEQLVGIPYLESGLENLEVNPSRSQPYYIFPCNELNNQVNFKRQSTTLDFSSTIGAQFCGVFNKYTDLVFNGYLNAMSSYNRLVMPSEEYRFTYGDEKEDKAKLLSNHAKYKGISIGRTSRGFMNADREKQLIVNLGIVKNSDRIVVKYKAKVSEENELGHILYNYENLDSKSVQITQEDNDNLLGFLHNKNVDIYSKSLNSELFFLSHFGEQVNVFNRPQTFDDNTSIRGKLEITPNVDLSIINLSGRKAYVGCNPTNESKGNCNRFSSIETLNRDGEDYSSLGEVIKKDGESQAVLYKGQKFFVRATATNNYKDKSYLHNTIENLGLRLAYNSDLVLFDGIVIENSFDSDENIRFDSKGEKKEKENKEISPVVRELIGNRSDYIQDIKDSDISESYKEIEYNLTSSSFNSDGGVTVDYLFTVKNSLNAENIKELFGEAYLKDIGGIFILDTLYSRNNNSEHTYQIDSGNTAFQDVLDYEGSIVSEIRENFTRDNISRLHTNSNIQGTKAFQYFKIPFSGEYKFNEDAGFITNLNPNLASFKARFVNIGGGDTGVYRSDGSDGRLALELLLSNTSAESINSIRNSLKFSLPNGFSVNKIDYTSFEDSSDVSLKLTTTELFGNSKRGVVENVDYGKKVYEVTHDNDTIIPGERVQYIIYLEVDSDEVDLYSSFTANIDIVRGESLTTLFTDASVNIESGLGDLSVKSLPVLSENDAYFGAGFIKNKVSDDSLLNDHAGDSGYNVVAGSNAYVEYSGNKANNVQLENSLQPIIYDMNEILDEKKNSYSVVQGEDLRNLPNVTFDGNSYILRADGNGEINLQNNTLYYFGEHDVILGAAAEELSTIEFKSSNNSEKERLGGITIFTKGTISVNHNTEIFNPSENLKFSEINYIAFMGQNIVINPRVGSIEGSYIAPLTDNAYITKIESGSSLEYLSAGNIGTIRPGYSNIPLRIKGSVSAGNIIREREINEGIEGDNLTEKYEFDFNLYLSIPPIIRK